MSRQWPLLRKKLGRVAYSDRLVSLEVAVTLIHATIFHDVMTSLMLPLTASSGVSSVLLLCERS